MNPAPHLATRAVAAAVGGALAIGLLTGCGGGSDDDGADQDEPAAESSSTGATSSEPTAGYLPVPEDVVLTEPGTALDFGEQATVAWSPRQDTVVALDLAVDRIDRTTFKESFEGWVVTAKMKGQVPYFVRVTATNVGEEAVGRLLVPLFGFSAAASMYEPLDFREEPFEPCPGGTLPKKLAPDASTELCFVYLLPADQELASAAFGVAGELPPVTWSGEITEIEPPEKKKGKKGDNDGNGDNGEQDG